MKNIVITFVFIIATLLMPVCAAQEQYEKGIEALFTNYMLKYNAFISTGAFRKDLPLYQPNVTFVADAGEPSTVSADVMDERVKRFLLNLKDDGVARVKWDSVAIHPLAEKLALVRNVAVRYRQDGTVFNRVGATYMIQHNEQGWRIAAFSVHPADYVPD